MKPISLDVHPEAIWDLALCPKPNEGFTMWAAIKRAFNPTTYIKICEYIGTDLTRVAVAQLTEPDGVHDILLFASDYTPDRRICFIYLTGRRAAGAGTASFDIDPGETLVWDGQRRVIEKHFLANFIEAVNDNRPHRMRIPMWIDPQGRKWYYGRSANLQDRGVRGKSFNLYRVRGDDEPEYSPVVQHIVTGFIPYYGGDWLDRENPVYDPDAYETVREQDILKAAAKRLEARYSKDVRDHVMLQALKRISHHLNINQPELEELTDYYHRVGQEVQAEIQTAIDDPRVHYVPLSRG